MYLLSVLESETYARCQKSLVAQSGFKKSSDAVITHTHGYRVHLKSQAGLRPGMGPCHLTARLGESFLRGAGDVYACGYRPVEFHDAMLEVDHLGRRHHEEVELGLLHVGHFRVFTGHFACHLGKTEVGSHAETPEGVSVAHPEHAGRHLVGTCGARQGISQSDAPETRRGQCEPVAKTMKHMKISTKAASFLSSIKTQTYDKKEREMIITYQQKRVFHLSLLMLVLCAPIYIYSVPFPNEQFYYINSVLFLFIIMCTLAYFKKRVNLTTTFSIILIAIHIEIFIEIIYCSICSGYEYSYQRALIMSNITISLLFTMLSICAYMSNISILLSSLTIASYTICTLITDEPFLYSYLPLIIIIYTMIPLLGRSLHSNISSLLKSSNLLKEEEEMLLKRLQMKKEELFAFAELLSENNPEEKTSSLLNIIGEQSKENLFTALAAYQKKEKSKLDTIRRIYPNLSPSELNICRLILQDKTVSQICELLHRSSGNITSQRANIRAKLGLKKSDNLKEALQERMRLYEEEEHRQEEFSAMR